MKKNILLFFSCIFILTGCQNVKKTKSSENIDTNKISSLNKEERLNELYHRFPSPEEMLDVINKDEIIFNADILNSSSDYKKYLDSRSQALNVGVYAADLAYLTVFEKHNEAVDYFKSIYNLTDELKISSAFDRSLLSRVQNNLSNSDSLSALSQEAFINLSHHLESNDQERLFAIISIGGFVEGLYLSFNVTNDFSETNMIVQRIADQKLVLQNLINYSSVFNDDQTIISTLKLIEPLQSIYNELAAKKTATTVTKNDEGKLVISGGSKIILSEEQFNRLKEETFKIRNQIIQN